MVWTLFWDMHSGGSTKESPYEMIYIEAPQKEAETIFYNRFGHSANRVSCTCCGEDYSVSESESLEQATAYHRNCNFGYFKTNGEECSKDQAWKKGKGLKRGYTSKYVERRGRYGDYIPLKEYIEHKNVLIIYTQDIKNHERDGEVPTEGYVWM